ncbi:hypothetical protein GCM10023331_30420 [Algivirga pacifica]|uniref:RHS repeat-associated core domain-containing protein n=1 Tax=Algivirga pacifica TaxID=1162670 RepID=A0ABP9DF33_9BACT
MDPLTKEYPWYTPYQFAGNKPIRFIDLDGAEEYDPYNDMVDPYLTARLVKTAIYDIKHALQNTGARILTSEYRFRYKKNESNEEIFETEVYKIETNSWIDIAKDHGSAIMDVFTVSSFGNRKLDATEFFSKNGSKNQFVRSTKELFSNLMPDKLADELRSAENLGIVPHNVNKNGNIDNVLKVDDGVIKWAVLENGEFMMMPKHKNGIEVYHPVLSKGKNVLAAGEGTIAGDADLGYYILEFNNYSGHFRPSQESLDIGKEVLKENLKTLNEF